MTLAELAQVTDLGRYVSHAITTPLGIPAMLLLVDQWRLSRRAVLRIAGGLFLFLTLAYVLIYQVWGVTDTTVFIVAWGTPVVCWSAFVVCCRFRDGRLLFSAITAFLLAFGTEALASMLVVHDSMLWVIYKVALTLIEILLLFFFGRKPFLEMLKSVESGWVRFSLVPLSLLLCLMTGYLAPMFRYGIYSNPVPTLLLCVAMLLIYNTLYRMIKTMKAQNDLSRSVSLLNNQMRFMEQQTKIMQVNDHDNRAFRHNMRHYMGMLRGCADADNMAGVQELLDSMEANFYKLRGHYTLQNYTGDPVVDSTLSFTEQQAALAGTKFTAQIVLPTTLLVDRVQLAVVLSNSLENSLNACMNVPEGQHREIIIKSEIRKQQFFLSIKNTFTGEIQFDPETGLPCSDLANHGYGTHTVMAFMKEYDAIVDFHVEGEWFCFGLLI